MSKAPPTDNASLAKVGMALNAIAGIIGERVRHEGQGGTHEAYGEHMDAEIERIRREGHETLADALAALRDA